jgi:hypothetical protein
VIVKLLTICELRSKCRELVWKKPQQKQQKCFDVKLLMKKKNDPHGNGFILYNIIDNNLFMKRAWHVESVKKQIQSADYLSSGKIYVDNF